MNRTWYLWLPCLAVVWSASSQTLPLSAGVKGLYTVYDTAHAEEDAFGMEGFVGLEYQGVHAELALGSLAFGQSDAWVPMTLRAKYPFDVAPNTQVYLGAGGSWVSDSVRPSLSGGVLYQVSPSWWVDAGYQALLNAPDVGADWLSFGVGVVYRMPPSPTEWDVPIDEEGGYLSPESESVIQVTEPEVQCQNIELSHLVEPGDNLSKIAKRYDLTLEVLIAWNKTLFQERSVNLIYPLERIIYQITECQ